MVTAAQQPTKPWAIEGSSRGGTERKQTRDRTRPNRSSLRPFCPIAC